MTVMADEFDKLLTNMQVLLRNIGTAGICKRCGNPIWWITHHNGKATAYTAQGKNHTVLCRKATRAKKTAEKAKIASESPA